MNCLALKSHLLPYANCVSFIPLLLFLSALFASIHLSFLVFTYFIYIFLFTPPVSDASSLPQSLLTLKMECFSVFLLFSTPPCAPNMHIQTFIILVLSSCFSLPIFSNVSVNVKLLGFFTCYYLWSCCRYHFHAPDKYTEYSARPWHEYFIRWKNNPGYPPLSFSFLYMFSSQILLPLIEKYIYTSLNVPISSFMLLMVYLDFGNFNTAVSSISKRLSVSQSCVLLNKLGAYTNTVGKLFLWCKELSVPVLKFLSGF